MIKYFFNNRVLVKLEVVVIEIQRKFYVFCLSGFGY